MVAIGSYVYNWVITKMGGTDNVQAIMKVSWYLQGYGVLLFSIGYTIVLVLMGMLGLAFDSRAFCWCYLFCRNNSLTCYIHLGILRTYGKTGHAYEDESIHC